MQIPKIIKNTGLYSIVSFLQKGISFFFLPIYTSYLSTSDYGKLSVIQSITSFLSIFFLLSLNASAQRLHYTSTDKYRRSRIWGTTLILVVYNSLFLGAIFILFHKYIIDPFAKNIDFFPLIFISLISTILSPLYVFFQSWLQTTQQGMKFVVNGFINFVVLTALTIIALIVFHSGIIGVLCSGLITSIIFFIYSFIKFLPITKLKINKRITIHSLKYALPLLPHSVSSWFMVMVDRIMINNFIGSEQTGLYSASYSIGGLMNVFTSSINQAFTPWFFQKISETKTKLSAVYSFAEISTITFCFLAMIISLFSPEVLQMMTAKPFHAAWKPVVFISFGCVFSGLYYFLSKPLWINNTKYIFIITLTSALLATILNLILIPHFGIIGSGISMLVSLFISSLVAQFLSSRVEKNIKFPWLKMHFVVMLFFVLSTSIFFIEDYFTTEISKICVKISLILVPIGIFVHLYKKEISLLVNEIRFKKFFKY